VTEYKLFAASAVGAGTALGQSGESHGSSF
jgi:hypothetical protein